LLTCALAKFALCNVIMHPKMSLAVTSSLVI